MELVQKFDNALDYAGYVRNENETVAAVADVNSSYFLFVCLNVVECTYILGRFHYDTGHVGYDDEPIFEGDLDDAMNKFFALIMATHKTSTHINIGLYATRQV